MWVTWTVVEVATTRHLVIGADIFFEKEENTKGNPQCSHSLTRGSKAACLLGLQFWIWQGAWGLCHVTVLCYQVEVSALGWSPVQRNPTECDVSECDHEASNMSRPWPTRGCCLMSGEGGEYNKYLHACIAEVHKMWTITLSLSNPIIFHP